MKKITIQLFFYLILIICHPTFAQKQNNLNNFKNFEIKHESICLRLKQNYLSRFLIPIAFIF